MEFYRFTEDWARVFLDLMGAHYGVRARSAERGRRRTRNMHVRLLALAGRDIRLQVDVGAASYWSENHADDDKRSSAGERRYFRPARIIWKTYRIITGTRQHDLLHALRVQRQQQKEANSNAETTVNPNPEQEMTVNPFAQEQAAEIQPQENAQTYPVEVDGDIVELTLEELIDAAAQGPFQAQRLHPP